MQWIKVLPESELAEGERRIVKAGEHDVLLLRHNGRIYATGRKCPHMGVSLERGEIKDDALICPLHRSTFDLETGAVRTWTPWPPGVGKVFAALSDEKPLPIFATKIEAGAIWINVETSEETTI